MSEASEFLSWLHPGGPWVLTVIHPDQKKIRTRTCTSVEEVDEWVAEHLDEWNVYYTPNPTVRPLGERDKTKLTDIAAVTHLHVDVDPRAGEDVNEEQARILDMLQRATPPPSCIVFSGGGYQALWKLAEPIEVDGDEQAARDAGRYNKQLEIEFEGDHCHDVSHILRLPGTINHPNRRKRERGRVRTPTGVELLEPGRVHDLELFRQVPEVAGGEHGFGGHTVQVSGNIERVADVDDLPNLSDDAKVVIVQGADPHDAARFPSRSEAVFYVCCEMVRAGIDDDTIYAVITDDQFGISSSILEKKGIAHKYAIRQIERARENAVAPELEEMNARYAVIQHDLRGKTSIMHEGHDPVLRRPTNIFMSQVDLKLALANRFIAIPSSDPAKPDKKIPLAKWWLEHPMRRSYNSVIFDPETEQANCFNLWSGFAVEPIPGDCSTFKEHVLSNVCAGNQEHFDYTWRWMAAAVQRPGRPGGTALVLRGRRGTGKSFFAKMFGSLFGRHYLAVADAKHLVGHFNQHLMSTILLFSDEAYYAGDKRNEAALKALITEPTLAIEPKGGEVQQVPNCLHIIMASNADWVIPAGEAERRFMVLEVGEGHMQDLSYFQVMERELKHGGREALLHELLNEDLSEWSPYRLPKSDALEKQKEHTLNTEERWLFTKLEDGRVLDDKGWEQPMPRDLVYADYSDYADARRELRHKLDTLGLTLFLKKISGVRLDRSVKIPGHACPAYVFPPLDVCRARWEEHKPLLEDWPAPLGDPEPREEPF